ncbi:MAG: NCS2 family permease [Oscillospiraceae bacterium]|nr:NCS2 family permease [Oscillospiraceae bacterium]
MEKFFKLKEHGTTVRNELVGGLTTFFAMAYIMFVNPNTLTSLHPDYWTSVFVATCISAAIGCILTAVLANVPFAQAPGMGLNAFFAFTVATGAAGFGMGYSFEEGLAIVFISGLLFLAIAVSPLRSKVISSIPASLKAAIGAGIGLFITIIGLLNAGIMRLDEANNITALNLFVDGALNKTAALALIGVLVIACLMAYKVKGAIFIGIIITTLIGIPMGVTTLPESVTMSNITMADTFLKLDFGGLTKFGIVPLVTAVISFLLVDMFDTVGTLIGTAGASGMLDEDGNLPGGDKALIADAIATCTGALCGTSTVTTFVESSTGISEGARTGLSSAFVGVLFLASIVLAPIAGIVPGAATAPALIIVGVLMLKSAVRVPWDDMEEAIPAFLTIAMMPFAYSISDGIAFGFISYTIIKLVRGKAKEVPALMYVLSALFIVMYVLKGIA